MANTQSAELALLEASPPGVADRRLVGSANVRTQGNVEFTPTDADDTLQICRVPADATLDKLFFAFDDNGTGITLDIGFYQAGSPGAAIDQNALVTLLDTAAAALAMADLRYETKGIETTGQRMWELAGLSARPEFEEMDIVITVVGDTTPLAGTVAWLIEYTK